MSNRRPPDATQAAVGLNQRASDDRRADSVELLRQLHDDQQVWQIELEVQNEQLRSAEREREQYFQFFQTSIDLLCIVDVNGAFTKVNPAFTELLGFSSAEILDRRMLIFVHPDDRQATCDAMARQYQAGATLDFENRVECKDGSIRHLHWRATVDPAQGLTFAIARDITDLRQRELAQRNNLIQLASAFEHARVGMALLSPRGNWIKVNGALCEMLGYTEEELLILNLQDLTAPDDYQASLMHWLALGAGRTHAFQAELRFVRRGPVLVWCRLSVSVPISIEGSPQYLMAEIVNISARMAVQANLLESERRLKTVVDSAMDAIISVDHTQRIVLFNATAQVVFGYAAADVMGQSLDRLIPPRYRAQHRLHMDGFAATASSVRALGPTDQLLAVRADGKEFPIEATISRNGEGEGMLMTVILRDITERLAAEQALKSLVAEKTALLNEVHHRVKNNLQIVSSLLRLESGRSAHAETQTVLDEMQGRIRSMALLHESLYRSGTFAWVDLGAYLGQLATQAFRAQSMTTGAVRLQLDLVNVTVGMDQATPCGLLVNELITNSLKHGFPDQRGGEIHLILQPETCARDGTIRLHLCLSDTGVGLPIGFDVQKLNSLGLQLAHDLAEQIGGPLEIKPGAAGGVASSVHFAIDRHVPVVRHPCA